MKDYTLEELRKGNGQNGHPTLVVIHGKVYDLSQSKKWINGRHMKRHQAGCDLTTDIGAAPHGMEVLEAFKVVGDYQPVSQVPATGARAVVDSWLQRHPFFQRHPHPAVVHLPVGIVVAMAVFELLALLTGSPKMEWAAFCCLAMVLVSLPPAIATGYFTWWINYECATSSILVWKRRLAWIALPLGALAVLVRLSLADPLQLGNAMVVLYVAFVAALTMAISCIGFLGGKLTFPYD